MNPKPLIKKQRTIVYTKSLTLPSPATDHRPPITDHRPLTTDHRPPFTGHRPPLLERALSIN
jgi:hypothetical protein